MLRRIVGITILACSLLLGACGPAEDVPRTWVWSVDVDPDKVLTLEDAQEAVAEREATVDPWADGFTASWELISLETTVGDYPPKPAFIAFFDVTVTSVEDPRYVQREHDVWRLGPGWDVYMGGLEDRSVEQDIASMPDTRRRAFLAYIAEIGSPTISMIAPLTGGPDPDSLGAPGDFAIVEAIVGRRGIRLDDLLWISSMELAAADGVIDSLDDFRTWDSVLAYDATAQRYIPVAESEQGDPLTEVPRN